MQYTTKQLSELTGIKPATILYYAKQAYFTPAIESKQTGILGFPNKEYYLWEEEVLQYLLRKNK